MTVTINIFSGDDEARGMLLRYLTDRSVDLETFIDVIATAYARGHGLTDTFGAIDMDATESAYREELQETVVCNGPPACLSCGEEREDTLALWRPMMDATGDTDLECRICGCAVIYPAPDPKLML